MAAATTPATAAATTAHPRELADLSPQPPPLKLDEPE